MILNRITLALFFFFTFSLNSQVLVSTRTAPLMNGPAYNLSGNAILEKYSDGSLKLSLDNTYNTQSGPDVQIFLSNSLTATSPGLMVADVGTGPGGISHFTGAITFPVSSGTLISTYQNIVFQCVQFGALWGNGTFGPEIVVPPPTNCLSSNVTSGPGSSTVHICPNDGIADVIMFSNNIGTNPNSTYSYVLTDNLGQIIQILSTNNFDFEGIPLGITQRVYGVSVDGTLNFMIGNLVSTITASNCALVSTNYIQIISDGCAVPITCQNSLVSISNGDSLVHVCPTDGIMDSISFANNLGLNTDSAYAYVLTDDMDNIIQVLTGNNFDFEGSPIAITRRVYGVSVEGFLGYSIGNQVSTIIGTSCAIVSTNFVEVVMDGCAVPVICDSSLVMHSSGTSVLHLCPTDGISDSIDFTNDLGITVDSLYSYVLTNELNEILQVQPTNIIDFEGSPISSIRHVYGVSHSGQLTYTMGSQISSIQASNCAIISANYIEVIMDDCSSTASLNDESNLENTILLSPNPANHMLGLGNTLTNIRIFNSSGSIVYSAINATSVDVSEFEEGLYFLNSSEGSQKFIVNK